MSTFGREDQATLPEPDMVRVGPLVAFQTGVEAYGHGLLVWHWCDHHLWAGRSGFDADPDSYRMWTPLVNCAIIGPPAEVANVRALVQGPATIGQGRMDWCTIDPAVASAYYDGIGRGVWARYCDVLNVTDGFRAFSTSANGARVRGEAVHCHAAAQFAPDYVNARAETHNDVGVQCQGNPNGSDTDIYFDGCWFDGRHSTTKGNTPPYRAQIAAIMVTPQAGQGAVHMTFTRGWLTGGLYCVNAGSDTTSLYGGSSLVLTNSRFERPGTNAYGDGRAPDVALAADPGLALTQFGNTYEDNGATVNPTNS